MHYAEFSTKTFHGYFESRFHIVNRYIYKGLDKKLLNGKNNVLRKLRNRIVKLYEKFKQNFWADCFLY